jgi:hypothetical protein
MINTTGTTNLYTVQWVGKTFHLYYAVDVYTVSYRWTCTQSNPPYRVSASHTPCPHIHGHHTEFIRPEYYTQYHHHSSIQLLYTVNPAMNIPRPSGSLYTKYGTAIFISLKCSKKYFVLAHTQNCPQ